MRNIACIAVLFLMFAVNSIHADTSPSVTNTVPNTELTPEQVVQIVVEALKTNDPTKNDDGIATVFEFASPGNKSSTGPLQRFKKMIKGGFGQMLNHTNSVFGTMEINEATALQAVWLTTRAGQQLGYVFQIGKQSDGEFKGIWMTESVWPIGEKKPQGQSI